MLWAPSTSFPFRPIDPLPMHMATVICILALAGKAVGVSMSFLAKIAILCSSKGVRTGARMTTRCDVLGLAHTESIVT